VSPGSRCGTATPASFAAARCRLHAVVKPSEISAIQTQVVTEALHEAWMLFACERPLCARSGRSITAHCANCLSPLFVIFVKRQAKTPARRGSTATPVDARRCAHRLFCIGGS
jgi:hypothetical protein